MAKLKKFMAIYIGSPDGAAMKSWDALDEKTRNERQKTGFNAWVKWVGDSQKSFVDGGSPLGKTKRVDSKGISDARNQVTAYTIVEAESHEAAAKLFLKHPHFSIFPGDAVEIMECLPIPDMPQ